jgi:hypothetical protein
LAELEFPRTTKVSVGNIVIDRSMISRRSRSRIHIIKEAAYCYALHGVVIPRDSEFAAEISSAAKSATISA